MNNYIFLDNWVLSDFTKPDKKQYLSNYLRKNNFTILIDTLSFVELYNPGWENAQENDRTTRAIDLICQHPTIIVDPVKVFRAEIINYPHSVSNLPIELDLEVMNIEHRRLSLKLFLHSDTLFIDQGKDIKVWAENYCHIKLEWVNDINKIIREAIQSGVLTCDKTGHFTQLETEKENFLKTLDRRHFSHFNTEERKNLGTKIVELLLGETSKLPAIRFTSLCFWYAYIQTDKAHIIPREPSDIGDFYQMSMIPYCTAFTTDNKMQWLCKRIMNERNQNFCTIINKIDLDKEIGFKP